MTVTEDQSTQITWDYIEEVDMEARCLNGKWGSEKWQWREVPKRVYYPEGLIEAALEYRDAETEEDKQRILQEYKDKGYGTSN